MIVDKKLRGHGYQRSQAGATTYVGSYWLLRGSLPSKMATIARGSVIRSIVYPISRIGHGEVERRLHRAWVLVHMGEVCPEEDHVSGAEGRDRRPHPYDE